MDVGGKKFERVKMFLAWRIMDALRANIMRFYSAIHIKHRKQQKARVEGRSAIKMPASKHIISTPPSHACVHHATLPISVRTVDSRRPIIIPRIIFRHFERKKEREKVTSRYAEIQQCINIRYRYLVWLFFDINRSQ